MIESISMSRENDLLVISAIKNLRSAIQIWAEKHDLWFDCGFADYLSYANGEPAKYPVITIMYFEGTLSRAINENIDGLQDEFVQLLENLGYFYESRNYTSIEIYLLDETHEEIFRSYFYWQWICSLVEEDFADVYQELYSYFASRPDDLYNLKWREYEILLARIFQTQGFHVELGPGSGDGGIDIRLLQRDPLGDVLTLVQAKKHSPRNKIKLQAVAALYGTSMVESAQSSLFVTTSTYSPVAKRFAERTSSHLKLATSNDVIEWCNTASAGIIADKSKLVSRESVEKIINEISRKIDSRVVVGSWGGNMTWNIFALVIKETKHAALLMKISNLVVLHDGYGQQGTEVPIIDNSTLNIESCNVWRVKRFEKNGEVTYWDGNCLYSAWNGKPKYFNYID